MKVPKSKPHLIGENHTFVSPGAYRAADSPGHAASMLRSLFESGNAAVLVVEEDSGWFIFPFDVVSQDVVLEDAARRAFLVSADGHARPVGESRVDATISAAFAEFQIDRFEREPARRFSGPGLVSPNVEDRRPHPPEPKSWLPIIKIDITLRRPPWWPKGDD